MKKGKIKEIKITKPSKKINLSQLDSEIQTQLNLTRMNDDNPNGEFAGLSSDDKYIYVIVRNDVDIKEKQIDSIVKSHIAEPSKKEKIKEKFNSATSLKDKIDALAEFIGLKD